MNEATGLLAAAWRRGEPGERDRLAFYLGLCADARSDGADARRWYAEAHREASRAEDLADREAFYAVRSGLPTGPIFILTATADDPITGPRERLGKAERALARAKEKLVKAEAAGEKTAVLKARVEFAGWLYLCGELAADKDRGPERLVSTANDYFDRCLGVLAAVTASLGTKPPEPPEALPLPEGVVEKDRRVADEFRKAAAHLGAATKEDKALEGAFLADPLALMHLDALAVRRDVVGANISESRAGERQRVEQLRALVKKYRGALEETTVALTHAIGGDHAEARKANAKAAAFVAGLPADAEKLRGMPKDDYFLAEDETNDFDRPRSPDFRLYSGTFAAQADQITAYLAVRAGGDREATKQAADLARAAAADDQPLARYALALAAERLGVFETGDGPADPARHAAAADQFKIARAELTAVLKHLDAKAPSGAGEVRADVGRRLADLESPDGFLARAAGLTAAGRPAAAADVLGEGVLRHRDGRLWAARAQARLRAGHPPEVVGAEFRAAVKAGVFAPGDAAAEYVAGRLAVAAAEVKGDGWDEAESRFRAVLAAKPGERLAARAHGFLAYTTARAKQYDRAATAIQEAERYFSGPNPPPLGVGRPETEEAIDLTEARALHLLAAGAVEAAKTDKFQITATDLYARATEFAARLPYPTISAVTGRPLVEAIRARPDSAFEQLAKAERDKRRQFESTARNLLALADSSPFAVLPPGDVPGPPEDPPAATPTDPVFDQDSRSEIVAFEALTALGSARHDPKRLREEATRRAAALAEEGGAAAGRGGVSPLLDYALGLSHESLLVTDPVRSGPEAAKAKDAATAAYDRARARLAVPAVRSRYPSVARLTDDALARLQSPAGYLREADRRRTQMRLADAEQTLRDGLARHPADQAMWVRLVQVRIDRIALEPAGAAVLTDEAIRWAAKIANPFSRAYHTGSAHEAAGQWGAALAEFRTAEAASQAVSPAERTLVLAKRVEAEIRAQAQK